jgi:hypothetical protein
VLVNGRWHGDDEAVAAAQVVQAGAKLKVLGGLQFFSLGLQRNVVPGFKLVNALLVDVEANDWPLPPKFDRKWKADVAQADDGQFDVLKVHTLNLLP